MIHRDWKRFVSIVSFSTAGLGPVDDPRWYWWTMRPSRGLVSLLYYWLCVPTFRSLLILDTFLQSERNFLQAAATGSPKLLEEMRRKPRFRQIKDFYSSFVCCLIWRARQALFCVYCRNGRHSVDGQMTVRVCLFACIILWYFRCAWNYISDTWEWLCS